MTLTTNELVYAFSFGSMESTCRILALVTGLEDFGDTAFTGSDSLDLRPYILLASAIRHRGHPFHRIHAFGLGVLLRIPLEALGILDTRRVPFSLAPVVFTTDIWSSSMVWRTGSKPRPCCLLSFVCLIFLLPW